MQRAANPWDRHYRFHAEPWRGERDTGWMEPYLAGKILELGAGNGKLAKPLARRFDVVPLDISFHALQQLGGGVLADAACLPFADASFGTVLDIHCTQHLLAAGREAAAREQFRVAAPGAYLLVEVLSRDDVRASKGAEVEPGSRALADGRTTHFGDGTWIAQLAAGWHLVASDHPTQQVVWDGVPVTRGTWRGVFVKP